MHEHERNVKVRRRLSEFLKLTSIRNKRAVHYRCKGINPSVSTLASHDIAGVKGFALLAADSYVSGEMLESLVLWQSSKFLFLRELSKQRFSDHVH